MPARPCPSRPSTCALVLGIVALFTTALASAACSKGAGTAQESSIVVFNAGSLTRPMRAALDSFAAREHITVEQENAGSLESARKLTELHHIPDIIAVSDYQVIPTILMPAYATWYARFARNRMVVAYTDRSRGATEITTENWWQILTRPGVEVGRSEPSLDPNGYRTLLVWQLAEQHYGQPQLGRHLVTRSPASNVRPKESDLVALLQAGEMDYIWSYESIAQAAGLRYVQLPAEIDLSTAADSSAYAVATIRIAGKTKGDSATIRGEPILYAFTIPKGAPHPGLALRFARFLLSPEGRRILRESKLDALEEPIVTGSEIPEGLP